MAAARQIILASCERGESPDQQTASKFNASIAAVKKENPNLAAIAARLAFQPQPVEGIASPSRIALLPASRRSAKQRQRRSALRIGIPKVLNLYAYGPLFHAYFVSLGLLAENIVYSDTTTQEQYRSTLGLAAVDPCFPSKVCISHVRNLLEKSDRRKLDLIFFPMIDILTTMLEDCAAPTPARPVRQLRRRYSRRSRSAAIFLKSTRSPTCIR